MRLNLWDEILSTLKRNGLTADNIRWIGTRDGMRVINPYRWLTVLDFDYESRLWEDSEIRSDLVVVGSGWWLERTREWGMEAWAFRRIPEVAVLTCEGEELNEVRSTPYVCPISTGGGAR